jgi:hypothetical protein
MYKPHRKRVKVTDRPYGEVAMTCLRMILYIIIINLLMHHHDFMPSYYDDDFIV